MKTPQELAAELLRFLWSPSKYAGEMQALHERYAELIRACGDERAAHAREACAQVVARNVRNWPDNPHIAAILHGVLEDIREIAP